MGGSKIAKFDMSKIFSKKGSLIFTTLRQRTLEYKINLVKGFRSEIMPYFNNGSLQQVIDKTYKLSNIRKAHEYVEANLTHGKVAIEYDLS